MRTLIYGAGAVGCYLGANLLRAKWPVTFLGREATAHALRSHGLTLRHRESTEVFQKIDAIHQLATSSGPAPDLILLTVKAYDCQSAAQQIRQIGWQAPIVSFINGVGSEEILAQELPADHQIIAGTLTTAVERPQPAEVHATKKRGLGLEAAGAPTTELAQAFAEAGLQVDLYSNPEAMKWSKLLSNLIGNASAALTGLTVGEIYSHTGLFRLELAMLREARQVMAASGIPPRNLPGVPIRWLALALSLPDIMLQPMLRRMVAAGRGGKRPSMYYDSSRGQTEINWLNGAVIRAGRETGVATPANRILTENVIDLAPGERLKPEQLLARAAAAGVPGLAVYNRPGT